MISKTPALASTRLYRLNDTRFLDNVTRVGCPELKSAVAAALKKLVADRESGRIRADATPLVRVPREWCEAFYN